MSRAIDTVQWVALLVILVLLLGGCVSLTPAQESTLADWKEFAHRVTLYYHVPDVTFLVGHHGGPEGGSMRPGGLMTLTPKVLEPPPSGFSRDFLIAHELAHYVLGHTNGTHYSSQAEWQRAQEQKELDANAEAVKILLIGRPGTWMTEQAAFRHVYSALWNYRERDGAMPNGHPAICVEINDLVRRYPDYRAATC